jgi:hypothetical protein
MRCGACPYPPNKSIVYLFRGSPATHESFYGPPATHEIHHLIIYIYICNESAQPNLPPDGIFWYPSIVRSWENLSCKKRFSHLKVGDVCMRVTLLNFPYFCRTQTTRITTFSLQACVQNICHFLKLGLSVCAPATCFDEPGEIPYSRERFGDDWESAVMVGRVRRKHK